MKKSVFTSLKVIGISLLLTTVAFGNKYESVCGNTTFVVKSEEAYKIYYKTDQNEEKFIYETSQELLDVACVKSFDRDEYLLLEETCTGSGCTDFGEYRIIDPISKKILLDDKPFTAEDDIDAPKDSSKMAHLIRISNHAKRNVKEAKKILGYEPPLLPLLLTKFCCARPSFD